MKTLIFTLTLTLTSTLWASPPPRPQVYTCHARMIDCYGRPLYTYWARGPQYQGACHYAANLCFHDARMGYGGAGARCTILGK